MSASQRLIGVAANCALTSLDGTPTTTPSAPGCRGVLAIASAEGSPSAERLEFGPRRAAHLSGRKCMGAAAPMVVECHGSPAALPLSYRLTRTLATNICTAHTCC